MLVPPPVESTHAALFRSVDGAQTWHELPGLRTHHTSTTWAPGAGGMCLHTIILDPSDPGRGRKSWRVDLVAVEDGWRIAQLRSG